MHVLFIVFVSAASFIVAVIAAHLIKDAVGPYDGSPEKVTIDQINEWKGRALKHNYFQRLLCEFDIAINVLFGGQLGETISSRTSRWARSKKPEFFLWRAIATWIIWLCDLVQAAHGVKAEAGDLARAERVIQMVRADLGLPPIEFYK